MEVAIHAVMAKITIAIPSRPFFACMPSGKLYVLITCVELSTDGVLVGDRMRRVGAPLGKCSCRPSLSRHMCPLVLAGAQRTKFSTYTIRIRENRSRVLSPG